MAHLAARLARLPDLDTEPITEERHYFRALDPAGTELDTAGLFDRMRGVVLRDVLPAPAEPIGARELVAFKEQHWEVLGRFRRWVESRLLECARERNEELRRRMLNQLRDAVAADVAEISARLRERRLTPVSGTLCARLRPLRPSPRR